MIQGDTIFKETIDSTFVFTKMDEPVFLGEEVKEEINFPFTENINRELPPDWIFYFAIAAITLFAWIKIVYTRLSLDIMESTVNYQLSLRLFKNANISQKRISLIYFVFYFLNFSVYLYLISEYFNYHPANLQDLSLLFAIFGFLVALSLLRETIFLIVAKVFKREKLFQEAAFHNSLFNKMTGVVALPFILIISYISTAYLPYAIYLSLFILLSVNALRLFRAANFVLKNVISYFYFILYLCALEFLPILVIIKVLNSL